jgi:hypothetical protein
MTVISYVVESGTPAALIERARAVAPGLVAWQLRSAGAEQ